MGVAYRLNQWYGDLSVKLVPYQQCRSLDGWMPVVIESASDLEIKYRVLVNPWGNHLDNVCECRGYHFRGQCHHQKMASEQVCRWSEYTSKEEQTPAQKAQYVCPRCLGPTSWEVAVEPDE